MDIFAAVVIYNRSCADSETCRALAGCRVPVLIYDNSTRDMGNEAWCREKGWTYLGGKGNDGISKAYNGCIDHLKQQGKQGYLCLLIVSLCALKRNNIGSKGCYIVVAVNGSQLIKKALSMGNHNSCSFRTGKSQIECVNFTGTQFAMDKFATSITSSRGRGSRNTLASTVF